MADYLVRRGGFWRFVRRVPKEYADFDKRGIVQQSTKIRVADDPKKMRARKVAGDMNNALERYWRPVRRRITRTRCWRWQSRTQSTARSRPPIGAVICSRSA